MENENQWFRGQKAIIHLKIIKSETLRKWLLTLTATAQPAILIQWGFVSQTDKTYRKCCKLKALNDQFSLDMLEG